MEYNRVITYGDSWAIGSGLDIDYIHPIHKDLTGLPKKVTQRLHYLPPSPDRWKIRSTTYQGIADAMASQWG